MGGSRWDASDWASYSSTTSAKPRAHIFTSSGMHPDLDPKNIKVRESVDSEANPNSTPVIIGVDVTGSMGMLAEQIVKTDLGVIMQEIYDRKPVPDPHVMIMGIGDATCDNAPLQVTQFEASIIIIEQIEKIYLEGGGGANDGESYHLPWYFAAYKTLCDSQRKRNKKGYLFTIGDEPPLQVLKKGQVERFFGDSIQADMTSQSLLSVLQPHWHVFHLVVKPVNLSVITAWRELLGQNMIEVSDHTKLAQVIISLIQVIEGEDLADVVGTWDGDTSIVVTNAIKSMVPSAHAEHGVVKL